MMFDNEMKNDATKIRITDKFTCFIVSTSPIQIVKILSEKYIKKTVNGTIIYDVNLRPIYNSFRTLGELLESLIKFG